MTTEWGGAGRRRVLERAGDFDCCRGRGHVAHEVSAEDRQANEEEKRWEWTRDAYSWSARDAMDLELSDCAHQGEDQ